MKYFIFSLIALLCWSGSDLFTKMGTKQDDKLSHWRVIFAVGLVMGLHAVVTMIVGRFVDPEVIPDWIRGVIYTDFKFSDFINYLPVAFVYLSAMVIGYAGLRYIELSLSTPVCNSSGSLAFVICALLGIAHLEEMSDATLYATVFGVVLIAAGILMLGFVEFNEDDVQREERQKLSNKKYSKSFLALLIPIIYLVLDALGTVGDQ
ncbi:MAG: hypothetical protein MJ072_03635, partial [Clostridia bacterium]|nr:hypothetical protein [Clostridia bacterium]